MPDVTEPRPAAGVSRRACWAIPGGRARGQQNFPKPPLDALLRDAGARHGRAIVDALVTAARGGDAAAAGALLDAIMRAGEVPP